MCKFYCMSNGPSTNLECLHCSVRYCAACLHGEAGKMPSLVKCAGCGKKPRTKPNGARNGWAAQSADSHNDIPTGRADYRHVSGPTGSNSRRTSTSSVSSGSSSRRSSVSSTGSGGGGSRRPSGGNIFDRLTDPNHYTGAHKHRFDKSGNGRGMSGRDSVTKGQGYVSGATNSSFKGHTNTGTNERIHDISQILTRR
jgi:hypothetical protein